MIIMNLRPAIYRLIDQAICCIVMAECVVAVSGLGMHITKSFGPITFSSVFIPLSVSQDMVIFESISKVVLLWPS